MEVIEDPPSHLFVTNPQLWYDSFRHFLFTKLVPRCLPNDDPDRNDYARLLISDEAMKIWVVGYTDPTFDPNRDSNYQLLELLGDRIGHAVFSDYVIKLNPEVTEEILTKINNKYLAKVEQAKIARKVGLNKWVRTNIDVSIHTSEDLFESTFGCLYKIGDQLIGKGNGYALCRNLMTNLFYDLRIKLAEITADPVTQIKEIFEKLNWQIDPNVKWKSEELGVVKPINDPQDNNKWIVTLKLTPPAIEFLKNEGLWDNLGPVLTVTKAEDKKILKTVSFKEALEKLNVRFKINYKWAVDFSDRRFDQDFTSIARNRMNQEGIKSIHFSKNYKIKDKQFLQLIGTNSENREIVLLTVQSNFKVPLYDLKLFTIRYYSANGRASASDLVIYDENF